MGNTKERQRRERKAFERGQQDRREGVSLKNNPLRISAGSTGAQWEKGWRYEDNRIKGGEAL